MKFQVGIRELIALRLGHLVDAGRVVVRIEIRSLRHGANFSANLDTAFRVDGIHFRIQAFLGLPFRRSGNRNGSGEKRYQDFFHIHIHRLRPP